MVGKGLTVRDDLPPAADKSPKRSGLTGPLSGTKRSLFPSGAVPYNGRKLVMEYPMSLPTSERTTAMSCVRSTMRGFRPEASKNAKK